jgi:cobalt-zinc-cadmium efflux system protein
MVQALCVNVALTALELAGGLITGSLALLADAGHVLTDVGSIALALGAATLATRSGSVRRTFGYRRSEVLAALLNGLVLVAIAISVVVAAIVRLSDPPAVKGGGVLALGLVALAGNALVTYLLARGDRKDLNLEAVVRHSAADALGALAVVISGAVILAGGSRAIDPVAGIAIAVLIGLSSVKLVRDPLDVLMEAAPAGVDVESLGRAICGVDAVTEVHELHVWTVTPGFETLAAHVVVAQGRDRDLARRQVEYELREQFGIEHTTLQMEGAADERPLRIEVDSD